MKILTLGTGAWATALSNVLLDTNNDVWAFGIDKQEIKDLNNQVNKKYFGDILLSKKLKLVSNDLDKIFNDNNEFDFILIGVPSFAINKLLIDLMPRITNKPIFINAAKGFDYDNNMPLSFTIKKIIKGKSSGYVSLLGPSFAKEVFKKEPTIVNAVGSKKKVCKSVAQIFHTNYFKAVSLLDEEGAEICSALKNVMAIACGITYELHTSINTRSALLAQSTKEIMFIIKHFIGKTDTLVQFCGIGDIFLTCSDSKSRNFQFGSKIAKIGVKETLKENVNTVEGYKTLKTAYSIVSSNNINAPVVSNLYKVVYKGADPKKFVTNVTKKIIN